VKPYKKIGEEAESDHGTDNELEVRGNPEIVSTKNKRRVGIKKKKQAAGDQAENINTEIDREVTKPSNGKHTFYNFI